jgi:hypothetical protein
VTALRRATAWELIGFDGACRTLPAGRAVWEAVDYDDSRTPARRLVKLSRLESDEFGLRQVTRYVDPDQPMEVLMEPNTW